MAHWEINGSGSKVTGQRKIFLCIPTTKTRWLQNVVMRYYPTVDGESTVVLEETLDNYGIVRGDGLIVVYGIFTTESGERVTVIFMLKADGTHYRVEEQGVVVPLNVQGKEQFFRRAWRDDGIGIIYADPMFNPFFYSIGEERALIKVPVPGSELQRCLSPEPAVHNSFLLPDQREVWQGIDREGRVVIGLGKDKAVLKLIMKPRVVFMHAVIMRSMKFFVVVCTNSEDIWYSRVPLEIFEGPVVCAQTVVYHLQNEGVTYKKRVKKGTGVYPMHMVNGVLWINFLAENEVKTIKFLPEKTSVYSAGLQGGVTA